MTNEGSVKDSAELRFSKDLFEFLSNTGFMASEEMIEDFNELAAGQTVINEDTLEDILRPLVVKDAEEDAVFHDAMTEFFEARERREADRTDAVQERNDAEQNLAGLSKQWDEAYENSLHASDVPAVLSEEEYRMRKDAEVPDGFDKLSEESGINPNLLDSVESYAAGKTEMNDAEKEDVLSSLDDILKRSILEDNADELMEYTADKIRLMQDMEDMDLSPKEMYENECGVLSEEMEEQNARIEEIQARMDKSIMRDVYKLESKNHRDVFIGRNAVHCDSPGVVLCLQKDFRTIDKKDMQTIRGYILKHRREFRAKLSRYISRPVQRRIDVQKTCQKAVQTDGVPMRIYYESPARKLAKVVLLLDISGSCSAATETMLTFMYYMQEAVPGGCLSYVFIRSLINVTDAMRNSSSPEEAMTKVMERVEAAKAGPHGSYSNYGLVFKEFCRTELPKVSSSRTYTFIIGDARNNGEPPEEECFKRICEKSMKTCWMCTEEKRKWNDGDCIMDVYGKYADRLEIVRSPKDIFTVLDTLN